MAINDIFRFVVYSKQAEQFAINVWHFRLDTVGVGELSRLQMANEFMSEKGILISTLMASSSSIVATGVRKVHIAPQSLETFSTSAPIAGVRGSDVLPRQTCGITTLRTVLTGRANRGRKYWAFPAEEDNEPDATPSDAYLASLTIIMDTLVPLMTLTAGAQVNTFSPVIFRKLAPATSVPIATYANRNKWATQRRRGSYGQPNVGPV